MKLSNYQAQILLQIAIDSSGISGQCFTIPRDQRLSLVSEILNQQDKKLVDLGKELKQTSFSKLPRKNESLEELAERIKLEMALDEEDLKDFDIGSYRCGLCSIL